MRNIEKLRNYFLGKDPQLKETMADNSLRLIGIEGKHFVLRIEMLRKLEALKKELTDEDEELQGLIDNLETALDDLELKHERDIGAVEGDIGAEESARILADNALSGRIDTNAGDIAALTFWKNTTDFVLASDLATALLDYYTKDEVDQLISVIPTFDIQVVQTLPVEGDSRVLYLAPSQDPETSNVYDEFIWVIPTGQLIGQWEKIGSTAVDMSNYYTKSETDTLLNAKQGTLTPGSNVQINGNTISATDTTYTDFVGTDGSSAGTSGLVPAPAVADSGKYLKADGTWDTPQGGGGTSDYDDLTDKPQINSVTLSGNKTSADLGLDMVILSYGNSTWQEFLSAYQRNAVVYCRASSASDPASGSQTRLAFMAYVNNATNPTEVEFQYYRSVGTKTASQQGDQVFVYKLTSSGTWTVTTRENGSKVVAGTNMTSTYSNGVLTLNATGGSGEMNTIDSISVNGVAQTPDANKNVDLTVPTITYGTTDLTPGTSTLADGEFYFVYE